MTISYRVRIDLSGFGAVSAVMAGVMPQMEAAVSAMGELAARKWREGIDGAKLWDKEKELYRNSIKVERRGPFAVSVTTDYEQAGPIETGRPPKDLKRTLDTSSKVRVIKGGQRAGMRYLVIPFRHNTPGPRAVSPMPADVYAVARELMPSKVTGTFREAVANGSWDTKTRAPAMVQRNRYAWGERTGGEFGSKYAGMYRFDTTGGGAKRSSQYLTFRVMREDSPGWVIPAQPGLLLAQKATQAVEPVAEEVFNRAMAAVLES